VATYNKPIINKGMLETYFYNLLTAIKTEPRPPATATVRRGQDRHPLRQPGHQAGPQDPGRIDWKMKEGLLIKEVQGSTPGSTAIGQFLIASLGLPDRKRQDRPPGQPDHRRRQPQGVFLDVVEVGSDSELQLSSVNAPSLLIKKLAIAGQ
jgi:hypothetical protein